MPDSSPPSSSALYRELLDTPDRDHCPGTRPVLALRDDDDPAYLAAVGERARRRITLDRRGQFHGEWAELEADEIEPPDVPIEAVLQQRWHTSRPIVWRGLVDPSEAQELVLERRRLFDELGREGGLRAFLKARGAELEPHYRLAPRSAALEDPERDIERHALSWRARPDTGTGPQVRDLWVKSGWLSTHEDDSSLRVRLGFGQEGSDDSSRDPRKHRLVSELAEILLPECLLVHEHLELGARLASFMGDDVLFSHHIGYWNAPGGGALFHHDAFDEEVVGGQRGVLYTQFSGSTAWLAVSIDDLALRATEFVEYLEQGELEWVRHALFPKPAAFEQVLRVTANEDAVRRELSLPGCGRLGSIVGRGPEFTALLADAGHAVVLDPGDAILLPNNGLSNTCMHSVFCADDEPTYALSCAIRERHPAEPIPPDDVDDEEESDDESDPESSPTPQFESRGLSLRRQRERRRRRR